MHQQRTSAADEGHTSTQNDGDVQCVIHVHKARHVVGAGAASSFSVTASVCTAVDASSRERLAARLRAVAPRAVAADVPLRASAADQGSTAAAHDTFLSVIADAVNTVLVGGSWRRISSARTAPPSVVDATAGVLGWGTVAHGTGQRSPGSLQVGLPPGSVAILELIDVTSRAGSAGTAGLIGCAILLPEWFSALGEAVHVRPSGRHAGAFNMSSLFTAPNPGWHMLAPSTAAHMDTSTAHSAVAELLIRVELAEGRGHGQANPTAGSAGTGAPGRGAEVGALTRTPALPPAALASVAVLPHHHTIYCDRKRQVCTGEGAVREGNCLHVTSLLLTGLASGGGWLPSIAHESGVNCTWYVSSGSADEEMRTSLPNLQGGTPLPASMVEAPQSYVDAATGVLMVRTNERTAQDVFSVPPVPGLSLPDESAIAPLDIVRDILATLGAAAASSPDSPLYSAPAALRLMRAEAVAALIHPAAFPIGLFEVGRSLSAVLLVPGRGGAATALAGPVEAAPPRIREIWIQGEAKVGSTLMARVVYYGGSPGQCEFSWVRVDVEGSRTESTPRAYDPLAQFPPPNSAGAAADPRCLVVTADDVGCSFKVTCEPVRSDGARGAPSTSKPTKDV